jgi:acyl-CoA thioester hydrolase
MMPLPATIGRMIGMPRKTAITVEGMTGEREAETRH